MAGVGSGLQIMFFVIAALSALSVGSSILVAQAVGARDSARASLIARQSMIWSVLLSIPLALVGFWFADPVTGQPAYTGAQVSRAARIEPIAPPGEIYASESFAALAAAHSIGGCVCNYVGEIPLAKGDGSYATYHVQRSPGQARGTPSSSY